jgi:hypothetical protein
MTTLDRARDIVEREFRTLYRTVPNETAHTQICGYCLGAITGGFAQCLGCFRIFRCSTCPTELMGKVVPMSVVVRPSPNAPSEYYTALRTYKTTQWKEYCRPIAALAYLWLNVHRESIEAMLGGPADVITIVPSKKGVTYAKSPLRQLLFHFGNLVQQTLELRDPDAYHRTGYTPEMFKPAEAPITGKRIILVEDTWITGATAVSAGGALLDAGAESVVITPIARDYNPNFFGNDHAYGSLLQGDFDVNAWPRLPRGTSPGWLSEAE